ncbi:glycoside hydrolase family 114 protein [Piromyces sp. E2]|nr:glycoside hydrolase family 114 protein [Piromyces sp. E2]|eukprot:OUM57997.1 glycoside hydrolase family 114 protein [Piromyces sp. E2]
MKFALAVSLLASSLLINVNAARWKPQPGLTWDYLIGGNKNDIENSDRDVVTIDLEYAEEMVPILHNKGQKVICYFAGGTTENNRPDKKDYEKSGLIIGGDDGWGNQILNIKNKKKLQPLIRKRFQRAYNYGCDAVEVDTLDVHNYLPKKFFKEDALIFAKWVAETGHEENISVGLKNLPFFAQKLQPYFDFAIVENCADKNECRNFIDFTRNKKAVLSIHYRNFGWRLSSDKLKKLLSQKNIGFTCILGDLSLHNHSINYNCNTGAIIEGRSKSKRSFDSYSESEIEESSDNEEYCEE